MAGIRIAEALQNLARTGRINQGDGLLRTPSRRDDF